MLRKFINSQVRLSRRFDQKFFRSLSVDGNGYYLTEVSRRVSRCSRVADVGGGKRPFFSPEEVVTRQLTVTGVDVDSAELSRAPTGAYSDVVVSRIENVSGPAVNDFVLAQSVLEHVRDGRGAIRGCAALLAEGGTVFTFCPNRLAWFALLNRLMPERLKRQVLFGIFPEKSEKQGFPAFYDGCTPREMCRNAQAAGLSVVKVDYFFVSSYFMFLFPLYLSWRLINWPLMKTFPSVFCETFMLTCVKGKSAP